MAMIFDQESRTFSEYLLVPNLTTRACTPDRVDLSAKSSDTAKGTKRAR